jgi:hypothetical protein
VQRIGWSSAGDDVRRTEEVFSPVDIRQLENNGVWGALLAVLEAARDDSRELASAHD